MKLAKLTFLILLLTSPLIGQYDSNQAIVFTDLESALHEDPARVYYLDLNQKGLDAFPREILRFSNLIHLNLAHNALESLEGIDLSSLKDLESIVLYDNKFRNFPYEVLSSAPNLRKIDLGENDLKVLDESVNEIRYLENLDLSGNRIRTIAERIQLPYLKRLNIERNNLSEVPAFLRSCSKLESLNLYGNSIEEIPEALNACSKMTDLNIGDNPLGAINENIKLRKLKTIILDWVDLSVPTVSLTFIKNAPLLEIISMEHCALQTLPKAINQLKKLKELSLLNNELTTIDPQLLARKKLKKLWIGGNQIRAEDIQTLQRTAERTEIIR